VFALTRTSPRPNRPFPPATRIPAHFNRKSPLYFQQLPTYQFVTPFLSDSCALPRGCSSVHSCTPAKRIAARLLCKSPLYFQRFTNCLFAKFFSLIPIQTAPWGGGVPTPCDQSRKHGTGYLPQNQSVALHDELTIMESYCCTKHTGVGVESFFSPVTGHESPVTGLPANLSVAPLQPSAGESGPALFSGG
jgi:hypothetical protein